MQTSPGGSERGGGRGAEIEKMGRERRKVNREGKRRFGRQSEKWKRGNNINGEVNNTSKNDMITDFNVTDPVIYIK